ncbi:MAG: hypothetical protein F6K09_13115, partial [Merismopedia sp. SIO2A8]|nr:hypothetical protein [Merismopedia sp. SIO2A8]
STVRAVPINGITASIETVESGQYPLTQTLFLYLDQYQLNDQSTIRDWSNFYLNHLNEAIPTVSLLPLTPEQLNLTKQKWLSKTMTQPGLY